MKRYVRLFAACLLSFIVACSGTEKPLDQEEGIVSSAAVLENGATISNLSGAPRSQTYFTLTVPEGASQLRVRLFGGSGDADLYVRVNRNPTLRRYTCRPFTSSNNETCSFRTPRAGTYHVMIRGYRAYSGATLQVNYTPPSNEDPSDEIVLEKDKPITGLSASQGSQNFYKLDVPSDAENLRISMSGGSGDADLYLRYGSKPTTQSYSCRPYLNGNNESCSVANPRAGTYYLMVRAYRSYSGVTLKAEYQTQASPPPSPSGDFKITLVFGSSISNAQKQIFNSAAQRWEQVITGDLPNVQLNKRSNLCGSGEPAYNGQVDDVVIYADVAPRDGPGGILASAGPCLIRSGGLTSYGIMTFDSADANGPGLYETILHEMGHVLGIGTLWETFGLVNYTSNCPAAPRYRGISARAEWRTLGGAGDIPVEQGGGSGTRCGHWDEETFDTELMTGFLQGSGEALSRMTIASLEDMGYVVDKSAADPYTLPSCSPNCSTTLDTQALAEREILLKPVGMVMPDGRIERLEFKK